MYNSWTLNAKLKSKFLSRAERLFFFRNQFKIEILRQKRTWSKATVSGNKPSEQTESKIDVAVACWIEKRLRREIIDSKFSVPYVIRRNSQSKCDICLDSQGKLETQKWVGLGLYAEINGISYFGLRTAELISYYLSNAPNYIWEMVHHTF